MGRRYPADGIFPLISEVPLMNRTFKTIWNAVRGQIVVVNEATTAHAQAAGESSKGGSTQSASEPQPSFLKTGVAAAVAGVL